MVRPMILGDEPSTQRALRLRRVSPSAWSDAAPECPTGLPRCTPLLRYRRSSGIESAGATGLLLPTAIGGRALMQRRCRSRTTPGGENEFGDLPAPSRTRWLQLDVGRCLIPFVATPRAFVICLIAYTTAQMDLALFGYAVPGDSRRVRADAQ
ncbi:MAG: hypothetical protein CM15mP74_36870 [Halieaceae bacterium]|nr:MAG: hypothetical protein CM15mP74_36870 [Halieaceae bacterium]